MDQNTANTSSFEKISPKTSMILLIIIVVPILLLISILYYYGDKEPGITISDGSIQISGISGETISFTEITEISLIEKSMKEIGVGRKISGFGGIKTSKGDFDVKGHGRSLLFVNPSASPTIRIERKGREDVYISFQQPEKTREVYLELVQGAKASKP